MEERMFDPRNLDETNYYRFVQEFETCVVIYPINLSGVEMITEKQLSEMRAFMQANEDSIDLWNEERMYTFITKSLADEILKRLRNRARIRFYFSNEGKMDVREAAQNFDKIYNELKRTI